jgi:hypothetical protein
VARRAISRIEAKGKGVLLLHDIHQRTVEALPVILKELKERGFRIVHVVPSSAELPATPTVASDWKMHPEREGTQHVAALPKTGVVDTTPAAESAKAPVSSKAASAPAKDEPDESADSEKPRHHRRHFVMTERHRDRVAHRHHHYRHHAWRERYTTPDRHASR